MDHELRQMILELWKLWLWMRLLSSGPWDDLHRLGLSVDSLLASNGQNVVARAWQVDHRGELGLLESNVALMVTHTLVVALVQVVEVDVAVNTARGEAHVIVEPIDRHDSAIMTSKHHAFWKMACVEVEDVNLLLVGHTGEQMTTIGEADLIAALDHDRLVVLD